MEKVWLVEFNDGDRCAFAEKADARNELWVYYMNTYFEEDSLELREAARKQFDEENYIDEVGWISELEIH